MSAVQLRPCPSCGSKDLETDSAQGGSWVQCSECEFKVQHACSEEAVAQRWNKLDRTEVKAMKTEMPNPSEAELDSPEFEAIWKVIKPWDINVPTHYEGYCGANGSHVKMILDALSAAAPVPPAGDVEVLGWIVSSPETKGFRASRTAYLQRPDWAYAEDNAERYAIHELVDRAEFTRLTAERDGLLTDAAGKVILAVQDICELEPADTTDPECICITASDLGRILSRHFEGIE